ncbi:Hpt domain-containing protein [Bermanella sp. R86510]|uniref:Hpt domain-containing protein n=1 Tax=unclassified Bermanella TaxID=2627862 RepID=UPI0037C5FC3F
MDHIDHQQMEDLKEIMEDDFQNLIETFLDDADSKLTELQSALNNNDSAQVGALAHSLKGSSSNICAHPLSEVCAQLEKLGKAGDMESAKTVLNNVEAELSAVREALMAL